MAFKNGPSNNSCLPQILLGSFNPNCHVVFFSPIDRLDDGKAALTIKKLNSLLSESSLDITNNRKTRFTQKSVAFEGQATTQDLINLRQFMPYRTT